MSSRSKNCSDVKCPPNKICNPSSNRCVLRTGKIGKTLARSKSKNCSNIKCPPNKICNPSSNRCVLRTGKIGKTLTKPRKSPRKQSIIKSPYLDEKSNINVIWGPVSLTEWTSNKYNKRIYVFGDIHVNQGICPPKSIGEELPFFIDSVLKNNQDKTIDLFIEAPYIDKLDPKKYFPVLDCPLNKFICSLQDCLQLRKETCRYKNARFHYADIRHHKSLRYLHDLFWDMKFVIEEKNPDLAGSLYLKLEKNIPEVRPSLLKESKIMKQIEAINDPEIIEILELKARVALRNLAINFDKNSINNILKTIKEFALTKQLPNEKLLALLPKYHILINSMVGFMDIYLLARLFKSPDAKNVIIFVGETHATYYNNLFGKLGFILSGFSESKQRAKNYQCVSLKPFKLPFFT
jgi:hypothetical protein